MQVWHYCASCDMSLICLVMRCNKLSCEELKVVTAARPFQFPDPPFETVCRTVWSLLHLVSIWKQFCSWSRSLTLSPISLISFTHPQWILKWFYYLDHYKNSWLMDWLKWQVLHACSCVQFDVLVSSRCRTHCSCTSPARRTRYWWWRWWC